MAMYLARLRGKVSAASANGELQELTVLLGYEPNATMIAAILGSNKPEQPNNYFYEQGRRWRKQLSRLKAKVKLMSTEAQKE